MIDPEINSIVENFNEKYKKLIEKQKSLQKINDVVMFNAKKFLILKKSKTMAVSNNGDAIITKDGMMVSTSPGIISRDVDDPYCNIDQSYNGLLPGEKNFNDSRDNMIFNGGNSFEYQPNIPCNYFNDLVQPGLDKFEYESTSFNDVTCRDLGGNKPQNSKMIKFNDKCKQNHFEICQSMAKLHKNSGKTENYFGLINDNNSKTCYCYIDENTNEFGNTIPPTESSHNIVSAKSKMMALMMDGSLMSYNVDNIHNTHDGVFNEVASTNGRTEIIKANVTTCNKYTGSMPYDYKIEFDTSDPRCEQNA